LKRLLRGPWALSPERARGALPFLAALAIALILWIVARRDRVFVVRQTVPVVAEPPPDSLVYLDNASEESVLVSFTAAGADVLIDQALGRPARLRLRLDRERMSGPYPTTVTYRPAEEQLEFTGRRYEQLTAESFSPRELSLSIDLRSESPRPVEVTVSGRLPARYLWVSASPETVTVDGPGSLVERIAAVPTQPVPLDGSVDRVSLAQLDPRISTGAGVVAVDVVPPVPPLKAVSVR
jgi:hypothetical protein